MYKVSVIKVVYGGGTEEIRKGAEMQEGTCREEIKKQQS